MAEPVACILERADFRHLATETTIRTVAGLDAAFAVAPSGVVAG